MDMQYEQFCVADPTFYESPERVAPGESAPDEEVYRTGRDVPAGWSVRDQDGWTYLTPDGAELPAQGWKVHVSATLDNASELLDAVWGYCVPRSVAFKFLSTRTTLLLRNGKYADRGGSGKFITVYPADEGVLERLVRDLEAEIGGRPGPYILNDLRWGAGPVHLRYGGFARRWCRSDTGELVPAIADPDGRLVPDFRGPYFDVPPWVAVPDFAAPQAAARLADAEPPPDFPYRIEESLHFSNGGGIYLATDTRDGRRVVLREARPHAGLDGSGRDAVARLARERELLQKLAGTGVVPELYEEFTCWEHHFLVEEFVEGTTLGKEFIHRYPLIHPDVTEAEVAEYTAWALDVLDRVELGLRTMHDHGIVFGDLHPHNVMVRPDGEIRFIDLEVASYIDEDERRVLGAAGYVPVDGRRGVAADLYALGCLRVALFLPLTALFALDPYRSEVMVPAIGRRFPVPEGYVDALVTELRPGSASGVVAEIPDRGRVGELVDGLDAGAADWPALRESIRDAILASATPDRDDRLFPGDIQQFLHNGIGYACGAAGVLHALAATGAGRYPEHERWLLDAVRRGGCKDAVGFYDGPHGVAYTLDALGRHEDALSVLEETLRVPLDACPANLYGGLAGIGLNLLHFAARTGNRDLHERALRAAERLVDWVERPADAETGWLPAGLLYGPSGRALFYVRLFEATGDAEFLDLAAGVLRRDLDRTVLVPDGTVQIDEGWRVLPYIATGSAGLGLVICEYLRHRDDEELATTLVGIRRAAEPEFIIGSGLFNGRAGLIAFLARLRDAGWDDERAVIDRHLRRLAWHVVDYQGHAAFPGDKQRRLSMDLATGSAGVLLGLAAAIDRDLAVLPFLTPGKEV